MWVAPTNPAAKTTKTIARVDVCGVIEAMAAVRTAWRSVAVENCILVQPNVVKENAAAAPNTVQE